MLDLKKRMSPEVVATAISLSSGKQAMLVAQVVALPVSIKEKKMEICICNKF